VENGKDEWTESCVQDIHPGTRNTFKLKLIHEFEIIRNRKTEGVHVTYVKKIVLA
jgi:hypothetical protein